MSPTDDPSAVPAQIPEAQAHPFTISTIELLRRMLAADEAATVKLLTTVAPTGTAMEEVIGRTLKFVELSNGAKQKAIGVLGLINASLRQWGADEVSIVLDRTGAIVDFGAASYVRKVG